MAAAAQLSVGGLVKGGLSGRARRSRESPAQFSLCRRPSSVNYPHLIGSCHRPYCPFTLKSAGRTKCYFSSDDKVLSSDVQQLQSCDAGKGQEEEEDSIRTHNGSVRNDTIENELDKVQTHSLSLKDIRREFVMLSWPAIIGQAIDPVTLLLETAYIGRLGSLELASAGVSITIFNTISKLLNIPLLSVATSFVAEDISKNSARVSASESTNGTPASSPREKLQLSSVSTALTLSILIGIFEALALLLGSGFLLKIMGIPPASPMHTTAKKFLCLRAIGAPALVVSLALQGIFRGFKDTKTPLYCLGFANLTAIILFPLLMYYCRLGLSGAAISTVASQYILTFTMIYQLNKRVVLLPPKLGQLQFGGYLKSGGFLIGRTLAVLTTMTLATSMAARQGPVSMAAHQICFQVWLAVSLVTDALATSSQALIATYSAKGDYETVKEITHFVLKIGVFTGVFLAAVLGVSFNSLSTFFTKDAEVLKIVATGLLFVCASQPINALAFIFDGLHYGVSDFAYAARSMMLNGAISSTFLLFAPPIFGLPGVWAGLTLFMGLRMLAGFFRIMSKESPWWFLHGDHNRVKLGSSVI